MSLFKNKSSTIKDGIITTISSNTYIKGSIKLDCNIYIDGKIEGDVESSTLITIGEQGKVIGNIKAKRIIISGYLEGRAEAQEMELINKGKIRGELISEKLSIEDGVLFEGSSLMRKEESKEISKKTI